MDKIHVHPRPPDLLLNSEPHFLQLFTLSIKEILRSFYRQPMLLNQYQYSYTMALAYFHTFRDQSYHHNHCKWILSIKTSPYGCASSSFCETFD